MAREKKGIEVPVEQPVLKLPTDPQHRAQLEAKLEEYRARLELEQALEPYKDSSISGKLTTRAKIAILAGLLERGELPLWDFSREFAGTNPGLPVMYGPEAMEQAWTKAAGIIWDYCETGGANVKHGGLPQYS